MPRRHNLSFGFDRIPCPPIQTARSSIGDDTLRRLFIPVSILQLQWIEIEFRFSSVQTLREFP